MANVKQMYISECTFLNGEAVVNCEEAKDLGCFLYDHIDPRLVLIHLMSVVMASWQHGRYLGPSGINQT
eukprot:11082821-Prorocentrum_lima.AAC.1